ncbi:hypothetical protein CC78DRAFT_583888 [Lojkania enalia]|uniref:Uncharacterized protein n=1 Tax=Lojkania enalia TaxID=147567 RepID=A0A9P4K847_9PLEO|nr:hypothetical protein CC78DRAFT_583888 [Didymosphaeria enalia]
MSGPWFFSFGLEGSFISKSFEGLRYRDLPLSLHRLIISGSVLDVYWAALGPTEDSWVLSFKDSGEKDNLGWGSDVPPRLQDILSVTAPSPHLRVFLGPLASSKIPEKWRQDSFIAWDISFTRWGGLPLDLEACLQSWLTPAGWRAGPPRIVTWGRKDAFFAMSEYGEIGYQLGTVDAGDETWPIYKETVEDWASEKGFSWDDLAYLSLDPAVPDQFIAIRHDGTWAGSIDDTNEEALEAFSRNFFAREKARSNTRSQQQASGVPSPSEIVPNPAAQAGYEEWATEVASSFALALTVNGAKGKAPKMLQIRTQNPKPTIPSPITEETKGRLLTQFPYLPSTIATCNLQSCAMIKADPAGLRACRHDVETLYRASGIYSAEWLQQERMRWHPDRFGRLCEEDWRETGRVLAEEMFKIIDILITELDKQVDGV